MTGHSEPLLVAPQPFKKTKFTVWVALGLAGMLGLFTYALAGYATKAPQRTLDLKANGCPRDNGGCCPDCEQNLFCASNSGCYAAGQLGCGVSLCPPPDRAPTHGCPDDNGGCCSDCEENLFCMSNLGCYAAGQLGCDVSLCPPPARVLTHGCPDDNGGCCLDCEENLFCASNLGCYAEGQLGCDVSLCPPPAQALVHSITSFPAASRVLRECSFRECEQATCDASENPYLCVSPPPAPYLGCLEVDWSEDVCPDSCSLERCIDSLNDPPVEDMPTCAVPCSETWCAQHGCDSSAPFQCVTGSAAYGCEADAFHFAAVSDDVCASCCDVRTC